MFFLRCRYAYAKMKEKNSHNSPEKDREYTSDNLKVPFNKLNGDSSTQDAAGDKFKFTGDDESNSMASVKEVKKQRHNQMEKKRKDKIKIGINHIGSLLPASYRNTQKESAHYLLEQAAQYILDLRSKNDSLMFDDKESIQAQEMQRIRTENDQLRAEVEKYKNILRGTGARSIEDAEMVTQMWKSKGNKGGQPDLSGVPDDLIPDSVKKKAKKKKLSVGDKLSELDKNREAMADAEDALGPTPQTMNPPIVGGVNMVMGPNSVPILPTGLQAHAAQINGPRPGIPVVNQNGNLVFVSPNVTSQPPSEPASSAGLVLTNAPGGLAQNTVPITTVPISSTQVISSSSGLSNTLQPIKIMPSASNSVVSMGTSETQPMPIIVSQPGDTVVTQSLNPLAPIVSTNPAAGVTSAMGQGTIRPQFNVAPTAKSTVPLGQSGTGNSNAPLQGTLVMHNGQLLLINTAPSAQNTPQTPSTPAPVGQDRVQTGPVVPQIAGGSNLAVQGEPHNFPAIRPTIAPTVIGAGGPIANTPMFAGSQAQPAVGITPATPTPAPGTPTTPAGGSNQTVTVNTPQGQVTLNTTPSQPNQLPSALILPNGQIVPVVTQPSLYIQQQQQAVQATASGGIVMPAVSGTNGLGLGKPAIQLPNTTTVTGGIQPIRGATVPQTPAPLRMGPGLLSTSSAAPVLQQMMPGNMNQIQSPLSGVRPPIVSVSTVIPNQTMSPCAPTNSPMPNVTVSTSSVTLTTGTTTEAKPVGTTSSTTSAGAINSLPSTVAAMLTPEGNIILLPPNQSPAVDPSKQKGKKGQRILMPKPGTVEAAVAGPAWGNATPPVSVSSSAVLKPEQSPIATSTSMTPLTISISTDTITTTTSTQSSSQPTDILAKAAESIFSSSPNEISPSLGGFYNTANEDNPLQIDTTPSQAEEAAHQPPQPAEPASKPKAKSRPRPRKKKPKATTAAKAAGQDEYEGMVIDLNSGEGETEGDQSFLDQLEDEKMDEDESDINDFSDLIKMHELLPTKKDIASDSKVSSKGSQSVDTPSAEKQSVPTSQPSLVPDTAKNIATPEATVNTVGLPAVPAPATINPAPVTNNAPVQVVQTPGLQPGLMPTINVPAGVSFMPGISQPGNLQWNVGGAVTPQLVQTPQGLQVLTPTPDVSVPAGQVLAPTAQPPAAPAQVPNVPQMNTVPPKANTEQANVIAKPAEPAKAIEATQPPAVSEANTSTDKPEEKKKSKKKKKKKDKDKDKEKSKNKGKDDSSTSLNDSQSDIGGPPNLLIAPSFDVGPSMIEKTSALITGQPISMLTPDPPAIIPQESTPSKHSKKKDKKQEKAVSDSLPGAAVHDNKENNSQEQSSVTPSKEESKKSKSRSRSKSKSDKHSGSDPVPDVSATSGNNGTPPCNVLESPPCLTAVHDKPNEEVKSKKSNKKSKGPSIRPEDIIPDSIKFCESDLDDVLDQVERYGETLNQSTNKPKRSRKKSKKSHAPEVEEPPSKKRKESDEPEIMDTSSTPVDSDRSDKEKEQRLDAAFGKSTGLFKSKPTPNDSNSKKDTASRISDPMDVFNFDEDDTASCIPPSPAPFKAREQETKKSDTSTPQKSSKDKRKSKHALLASPAPPPPLDTSSAFPATPGSITSYAPQISPNKSLFDSISNFMGGSGFDMDTSVSDTPNKASASGLDTPVAKLSPKMRTSRKDNLTNDKDQTSAKSRQASLLDSLDDKAESQSSKKDDIFSLQPATPGMSHARHTNLVSLAQQVAPPKYGSSAVQLKPPSTPLSLPRYHDKSDDVQAPKENRKQSEQPTVEPSTDNNQKSAPQKSSQDRQAVRPPRRLSPELVMPPVGQSSKPSQEKKSPEKAKSSQQTAPSTKSQKSNASIDLTNEIPSLSPVGTQRELAYSAEQLFSPSKLPTMDSSATSSEKKTGSEQQHNHPATSVSQPSKPSSHQTNTSPRGQPPSLYHQGSSNSNFSDNSAVHRGHHTVHHGSNTRDNTASQKDYFPPPAISTVSSCAYKNKNQDPFHFSPQFPSGSIGGVNGPSANVPAFSIPPVTSNANSFSFSLSSTTNSSTTASTSQHVRQGHMYGGPGQSGGQAGRHQFTPFYNPIQPPISQAHGSGPSAQQNQQHMAASSQPSGQHMPGFNSGNHMAGHGAKSTAMSSSNNIRPTPHDRTSREKTPTPNNTNTQQPFGNYMRMESGHHHQREGPPQFMEMSSVQPSHEDKDPHNMMQGNQNRLPTPNPSNQNRSRSSSVTSIGRSPQMPTDSFMSPAGGSFSHSSGGASSLTSPPLHHHGPSPDQRAASRTSFEPSFPSPNPQFSPVPTFNPPPFEPPPLTFSTRENTTSQNEAQFTTAQSMRQKSTSRPEQRTMGSSKPQGSHQGPASQQSQSNSAPSQHNQQGKSSRSSGSSKSTSKKSKQHNYDTEGNSGMFDSRSMTPYFPIGNLSSSPPRMNSDGPTYIPNLFPNATRQLSNTNTLQHKDNNPFNLFNSRGQNGIGLNFQAGFGMNPMHGNHVTTSQLTPHSNSVSVTPHMVPNFNIGNIFSDMNNASQGEGLNISPIKFPHGNHMLPQTGMEQHPLQHHHQAGSIYPNRPQVPPHMLHNMSINSLLGHQHPAGFEGRGVGPGINSTMGAHFPSHGHTTSFGVPLNFPGMHDH